ncbi:MAG: hypothetical protein HYR51_08600 [Candidatus Rokubacteria bacterium]|nr:hypothetical protein [Candidatus Rokubacteria bacterium]
MSTAPGVVAACPCGEVYELKPEYAGVLLECPVCHRQLRAPRPGVRRPVAADVDPAFDRDVFLLNQRALTITSQYEVWSHDGHPLLYVERPTYPVRTGLAYLLGAIVASFAFSSVVQAASRADDRFAGLVGLAAIAIAAAAFLVVSMSARPLRHVTVYRDESRREALLRIRQDQRVAILARSYTLATPAGEVLARFRKVYVHNLVRKRWYADGPDGRPLARAIEDSIVLSLLRRVLGTFFGILRTNFLLVTESGEVLGEFNRKFTLFDRYVLDLGADTERRLDRRVALALGIMLDTGERR